eukprot:1157516-Pelagomonas_calceolata.AAC.7
MSCNICQLTPLVQAVGIKYVFKATGSKFLCLRRRNQISACKPHKLNACAQATGVRYLCSSQRSQGSDADMRATWVRRLCLSRRSQISVLSHRVQTSACRSEVLRTAHPANLTESHPVLNPDWLAGCHASQFRLLGGCIHLPWDQQYRRSYPTNTLY